MNFNIIFKQIKGLQQDREEYVNKIKPKYDLLIKNTSNEIEYKYTKSKETLNNNVNKSIEILKKEINDKYSLLKVSEELTQEKINKDCNFEIQDKLNKVYIKLQVEINKINSQCKEEIMNKCGELDLQYEAELTNIAKPLQKKYSYLYNKASKTYHLVLVIDDPKRYESILYDIADGANAYLKNKNIKKDKMENIMGYRVFDNYNKDFMKNDMSVFHKEPKYRDQLNEYNKEYSNIVKGKKSYRDLI